MVKETQSTTGLFLDKLGWMIGTGFGSGLFPIAPATAGSFVSLLIYYFLPISSDSIALYLLIVVGFLLGVWATGTLSTKADEDPSKAVWDEFVGLWVTCLLLPKEIGWLAAAFIIFRILDILKPWPARRLEGLHGGLGIMADDLMVGVYGAILLNAARLAFFS
ncbi:MAG: phosphatidylglycerophosphatase A [Chloroflexi bacterium]|nr:phosphatidylglycerophosphatase A [Chloroflexota bacterium]MDA1218109.1 phosphatidylglycerophosphatase A [Chloroflexota bacterium]